MQKVDFPSLAPSLCVVCEQATVNMPFCDTGRTFQPVAVTHLDGRKYLCESCVRDAAHCVGIFDQERIESAQRELDLLAERDAAVAEAEAAHALVQAVEAFKPFMPPAPVVKIGPPVVKRSPKPKAVEAPVKHIAEPGSSDVASDES